MSNLKNKKQKPKRKIHKTSDPTWDTRTYSGSESTRHPFNIEFVKYYNPFEGRNQIIFLYIDKESKKICKYRILR